MNGIRIKTCEKSDPDFADNCRMLDMYLEKKTAGKIGAVTAEIFARSNRTNKIDFAIVAYMDEAVAGAGALRKYCLGDITDAAEIKRVFVREKYRGHGVGSLLVSELVKAARDQGYRSVILETGKLLEDAIRLYVRLGFRRIPNYGHYKDVAESICMKKDLQG